MPVFAVPQSIYPQLLHVLLFDLPQVFRAIKFVAMDMIVPYSTPGAIMAAATTLPIVATIVVALRFYVRVSRKQGIGADDWLLLPSLVRHRSANSIFQRLGLTMPVCSCY